MIIHDQNKYRQPTDADAVNRPTVLARSPESDPNWTEATLVFVHSDATIPRQYIVIPNNGTHPVEYKECLILKDPNDPDLPPEEKWEPVQYEDALSGIPIRVRDTVESKWENDYKLHTVSKQEWDYVYKFHARRNDSTSWFRYAEARSTDIDPVRRELMAGILSGFSHESTPEQRAKGIQQMLEALHRAQQANLLPVPSPVSNQYIEIDHTYRMPDAVGWLECEAKNRGSNEWRKQDLHRIDHGDLRVPFLLRDEWIEQCRVQSITWFKLTRLFDLPDHLECQYRDDDSEDWQLGTLIQVNRDDTVRPFLIKTENTQELWYSQCRIQLEVDEFAKQLKPRTTLAAIEGMPLPLPTSNQYIELNHTWLISPEDVGTLEVQYKDSNSSTWKLEGRLRRIDDVDRKNPFLIRRKTSTSGVWYNQCRVPEITWFYLTHSFKLKDNETFVCHYRDNDEQDWRIGTLDHINDESNSVVTYKGDEYPFHIKNDGWFAQCRIQAQADPATKSFKFINGAISPTLLEQNTDTDDTARASTGKSRVPTVNDNVQGIPCRVRDEEDDEWQYGLFFVTVRPNDDYPYYVYRSEDDITDLSYFRYCELLEQ